ncbi:MAG: sugar transferase [Roseiflexaceae bacterium]|nr:sugar transferase [Roseiflexaceae bacterium]
MDSFSIAQVEQIEEHATHGAVTVLPHTAVCAAERTDTYYMVRRLLDLGVGFVALVVTLPIMLLITALIRLDSPGPALFRQRRVGKNGRLFTFYKFRTMWCDARERFPDLYTYQYSEREIQVMTFKLRDDPRLTRFGSLLRKTSLDELPNFINVVLGTMALVGPRPEIPQMVPYYTDTQLMKFSVKPGVTGLAQISGRGNLPFQATIDADLEYCRCRSLRYDIGIFLATIKSIVIRNGAF